MGSPDLSTGTPQATSIQFAFDNTYARLPDRFYARLNPTPVAAPHLVKLNIELAQLLGLNPESLASSPGVNILAGNAIASGSEPLAQAYAGHQFGHFVPQLGDGRANLLGEVIARNGQRYDIQLKGSGRTPFSRGGDGRAALGPVLREYIVSEAMAALGIPSTRALAAVTTGERVLRESVFPGAILTRVAASHLRVGTFQFFAAHGDTEATRLLADYAIARHYPHAADAPRPYQALLESVIARQAQLIAQWMLIGFVHGVMNTDNTSISGETIDFGPCAFMEAYDPATVFSSIDHGGRYAYANQPRAAQWNLARLAEALLPVLVLEAGSEEPALAAANQALAAFEPQFNATRTAGLLRKIGLNTEREGDLALAEELLECMHVNRADFTLTFRRLCEAAATPEADQQVRTLFANPTAYDAWSIRWRNRLEQDSQEDSEPESKPASIDPQSRANSQAQQRAESMRKANPAFIPRNHLVEAALDDAARLDDFKPFEELLAVVTDPFTDQPNRERYAIPARKEEQVLQTFCGT
jgi:uncharacterized protein YdiU (UPF0061 family)